jgi:hypothetical protein
MTGFTTAKAKDMSAALEGCCISWDRDSFLRQIIAACEPSLRLEIDNHQGNDDQSRQRAGHDTHPLDKRFHFSPRYFE